MPQDFQLSADIDAMDERCKFITVNPSPLIRLALTLITVWGLILSIGPAHAAVFACPAANGDTVYQDRPCAKVATKTTEATGAGKQAKPRQAGEYPLGMHASWFLSPLHAPQPAYCDRLGCDCASQTRNFRRGLTAAVTDALYLETEWHRYAEQVVQMETDPPKGLARLELQVGIEDSACEIQMSQATVKNYVDAAIKELALKANAAKSRGNTEYDQCDGTDAKVCADVEAVALYERALLDIETLKLPRYFLIADAE